MATAEEVTSSGLCSRLRELQPVSEGVVEAVSIKLGGIFELSCESVDSKRKKATLIERNTDLKTKLVKVRSVESVMRKQLAGVKRRITTPETQLDEAQSALEKSTVVTSMAGADLRARVVAVEQALNERRVCVEHLERDIAEEGKKRP